MLIFKSVVVIRKWSLDLNTTRTSACVILPRNAGSCL